MGRQERPSQDLNPAALEALAFASHGRRVLPVYGIKGGECRCRFGERCDRPGKHPRINRPYQNSTSDIARILKWAAAKPDSNWAWVPGRSNHAVVDVDQRNGGSESLLSLVAEYGSFPDTETVQTGDGTHHVFKVRPGDQIAACQIAAGLELKTGSSSYVMIPHSRHFSGREYTYEVGYEFPLIDPVTCPHDRIHSLSRFSDQL